MAQRVLYNNNGRLDSVTLQPSSVDLGNVTNDLQIPKSIVTAKGDILTATANATPVRQAIGSNGQIIVADSNLTNGLGYKDPAFRNWVINGNFDIAQRGTSFTNPAVGAYSVDRFKNDYNKTSGTWPSTITHSQEKLTSGDIPNSSYFYRIALSDAGSSLDANSYYRLNTFLEHATRNLCGLGKKITLSFYARSSIAGQKLGCWIVQSYGTGGSPSSSDGLTQYAMTLSSSWAKYPYTFATSTLSGKTFGTNNDDYLRILFYLHYGSLVGGESVVFAGAGNIDIAQVALYAGDVAYPFEPVPYDIELQRCIRFCQRFNYNEMRMRAYLISTNEIHFCYPISEMRIKPTASLNTDYLICATNGNPQSGFTFDINSYTNKKMCYIIATKNSHGLSDAFLVISANGSALFDADF